MSESLIDLQRNFTAYIRDPEHNSVPQNVSSKRMQLYRQLVYNNVSSGVTSCFPVLSAILGEEKWRMLFAEFLKFHKADLPYYNRLPEEFLHYLHGRGIKAGEPTFLYELAHYEWVELALLHAPTNLAAVSVQQGDLLKCKPCVSPLAWVLSYRFPVHRLSLDYQPQQSPAEPTYLVVYRTASDEVNFMVINAVTARLLCLLQDENIATGQSALEQVAKELECDDPNVIIEQGRETLKDLLQHDIILGVSSRQTGS